MPLKIHVSTSLETLAELFRTEVYEVGSGDNILKPVRVTVQTQGVATWLKQYLAVHSPIAMNLEIPFLRSSVEQTLREYYPQAGELEKYSIERDTWMLFHYLSLHGGKNEIPELDAYLRNDPDLRKQYQISRQIASVYEQYRTYRPELISQWRQKTGPSADWQEKVYRDLFAGDFTFDYYMNSFIRAAEKYTGGSLKKVLTVFGISSMPPFFFHFFRALAKYQDVFLFYLAPSSDYWTCEQKGKADTEQNPLLQAFGTQGSAFFEELISSENTDSDNVFSSDPERNTFLGALQKSIRENYNGRAVCEPDGTVLIENCHTPLREIEVLHDRLLHEMKVSGRKTGDILVTAPDIEQYVPYIETVFGSGPLADCYTIADRSLRDSGTILPALLEILHLPDSNYSNTDIFSLLEVKPLREKFSLEEEDILQLKGWCSASGVRWGVDGEHREKTCGVRFEDFSWRQGIRRLLFGYAVSEDFGSQLDLPELPVDFAEGSGAEKLGCFLDFLDELFRLREMLSGEKTPKQWFHELKELPDRFFLAEEPSLVEERAQLIRFLSEQIFESSVCDEEIPFPVILDILERAELTGTSGNAFLRGKITFCSMVPMRTIPMPVVAILGLNAGEFPRRDVAPGFNLIAKNMKKTDRSKNLEDRYLLLETLLAVKEKLMIFYIGQDKNDNSEVFPTPPLAELILYLDRLSAGEKRKSYLVKHHLQAFAEDYFNGSDPLKFSYSASALEAAEANRRTAGPELSPLDLPDLSQESFAEYELPEQISLSEMETFFASPVKYYLSHQKIGRFTEYRTVQLENEELFLLDPLETHCVKNAIVQFASDWSRENPGTEIDYRKLREFLSKTDQLPCREVGEELFQELRLITGRILAETFLQMYSGQKEEAFSTVLTQPSGTEVMFSGKGLISADHTGSVTFHTADLQEGNGNIKQKYLLKLWLRHLFFSAVFPEYETTVCRFEDSELTILPVDQGFAQNRLMELARICSAGKERLIPFFTEVKQVEEFPAPYKNGKPKPCPVDSETYRKNVLKAISHDYCAALFFTEADLEQPFLHKVCRAVQKIYQGMELKNEMFE